MTDLQLALPPDLDSHVRAALARADADRLVPRIWEEDASVWTGADEARWLGWLRIVEAERRQVDTYLQLRDEVVAEGLTRVLLVGMGGSSLAPEVLARTFGPQPGFPSVHILDSTDPAQVASVTDRELDETLVIVSSKSGSTLEPGILNRYLFERMRARVGSGSALGRRFVAITDPGSQLELLAGRDGFRRVLSGVPAIGGRFSALSAFGLVPAALAGIDIARLLDRAAAMMTRCGADRTVADNPGAVLGLVLGESARLGRDKPTLVASPGVAALGAWLEQLIAESTGKHGQAILPIDGERLAPPDRYGDDRLFIHLRLKTDRDDEQDRLVGDLERAGQPLVRLEVTDRDEIGAEFFRWEMATAVAGACLQLNPFDQPDVESAKEVTRRLAADYETAGSLPAEQPVFEEDGLALVTDARNLADLSPEGRAPSSVAGWIGAHFARLGRGDYAALLAYLPMTAEYRAVLDRVRHRVRDRTRAATSVGFGPRYLHSTGQAYKGGPNTGVFLVITADATDDVPVPGQRYTFGVIEAAQARGDVRVLLDRGRRVLQVHLGRDVAAGLRRVSDAVDAL